MSAILLAVALPGFVRLERHNETTWQAGRHVRGLGTQWTKGATAEEACDKMVRLSADVPRCREHARMYCGACTRKALDG